MNKRWEIEFIEVGRGKQCWKAIVHQYPTEAVVARLAEPKLASRGVDAVYSEKFSQGGAIIVGGWRQVGSFQVRELEDA